MLLVFDQLPAWLLERYAPFFDGGHFGGIDGASFDAVYAYAGTETGPGHATLSTCALPAVHGIATRLSRNGGKLVGCLEVLRANEAAVDGAFEVFFPDLINAAQRLREEPGAA